MKLLTLLLRSSATFLFVALLFVSSTNAATLISSVNKNVINNSQTINLTVRYDKKVSGSRLDTTSLEKDFEILSNRPNSSSSTSIINGRVTKDESTVWSITLAAKRDGELTIPAFEINGDKSKEIIVRVKNDTSSLNTQKDLSVFVSTDKQTAYESQQILLEVELSAAQGLSDFNGSKVDIQGAQTYELGQRNEQRVDNGIVRNIYILSYAVFPEQAGELRIPSLSFTAVKGQQRRFYGNAGGEQVIARSTSFNITVKPADKTHSPWFIANDVQIISQWSGDTNAIIAGEPITRTLTIRALGQQASAIPPLVHPSESGYKSYKDQAQLDTKAIQQGFLATRIESEAIVVSTPGTLTLPAINLKWWNTNKGVWQDATVPEQILTVLPSTNKQDISTSSNLIPTPQISAPNSIQTKTHWLWPVISAALLLICLIQGYFLWLLSKRSKSNTSNQVVQPTDSESKAWSNLNKSFKSNDPQTIRQALTRWAQTISPSNEHLSLNALANYSSDSELNKQLQQAITELEASLYKEQSSIDSSKLKAHIAALRHVIKTNTQKDDGKALVALYKN